MIALLGKQLVDVEREEFLALAAASERVVLDVGAGDGRFPYRLARDNPSWLVVGLEPVAENVYATSRRAARKPEKGGLPNVLFVVAAAEALPSELDGTCDEILVILPWGRLMRSAIEADPVVLEGLRRVAKPGASVRLILNTEIFQEPVPIDAHDLPGVTESYAAEVLRPRYRSFGIELDEIRLLDEQEVRRLRTTWARKLAHGRSPRFLLLAGAFAPDRRRPGR